MTDRLSRSRSIYSIYIKRCLDLLFAVLLLFILLVPFILIAVIIKSDSKGPIIFSQTRLGKDSRPFNILKFRTMKVYTPDNISTASFDNANQYITKVGKILRKTSIDELPQLINILKGEMSFIGPRPLISEETRINKMRHQLAIDRLLPGITGLAQVNGRDLLSDHQKIQYDLNYLTHIGFILDIKIAFATVFKVAIGKDIHDGK